MSQRRLNANTLNGCEGTRCCLLSRRIKRPRTAQSERYDRVLELKGLELTSSKQDESSFCVWVIISRVLCIALHRVRLHSVSVVTQAHKRYVRRRSRQFA